MSHVRRCGGGIVIVACGVTGGGVEMATCSRGMLGLGDDIRFLVRWKDGSRLVARRAAQSGQIAYCHHDGGERERSGKDDAVEPTKHIH